MKNLIILLHGLLVINTAYAQNYDSLYESYHYNSRNNIITLENSTPDFGYFPEYEPRKFNPIIIQNYQNTERRNEYETNDTVIDYDNSLRKWQRKYK